MDTGQDLNPRSLPPDGTDEAERPRRGIGRYLKNFKAALRFRRHPNANDRANTTRHVDETSRSHPTDQLQQPQPELDHNTRPGQSAGVQQVSSPSDSGGQISEPVSSCSPDGTGNASNQPEFSVTNISRPEETEDPRTKRAADLFRRYGLRLNAEFDPYQDTPLSAEQMKRVAKPKIMRVHHHCHHCSLEIGATGVCVGCRHKLCRKCYRYPEDKTSPSHSLPITRKRKESSPTRNETLEKWLAQSSSSPLPAASYERLTQTAFVTKRIRMTCCRCSNIFIWAEKRCQNCNHSMCSECPRGPTEIVPPVDPFFNPSAPYSQPLRDRERMRKRPRVRIKYTCERCGSLFQEFSYTCSTCGHVRCGNCLRSPPKRDTDFANDPDLLERLRRRLGGLTIPEDLRPSDDTS